MNPWRLFFPLTASWWILATAPGAAEPPLTSITAVRNLSLEALAAHPPARMHGVITWRGTGGMKDSFCVQGEAEGIFINGGWAKERHLWEGDAEVLASLVPGMVVELEGVVDPGGYGPVILPRTVRVTGSAPLPKAQQAPLVHLMNGACSNRRVELTGVVQAYYEHSHDWTLRLNTGLGQCLIMLPLEAPFKPELFEDAEVRVQGVVTYTFDQRGEFKQPRLMVNRLEDVVIEKAAPQNPFTIPKVPLPRIAAFSPMGRTLHRVRVEGIVTYFAPGEMLYLQEGDRAIRVSASAAGPFQIGEQVEAAGFIDSERPVAGLRGAFVRTLGAGSTPQPLRIGMADLRKAFEAGKAGKAGRLASPRDYDCMLVSVTGRLLKAQRDYNEKIYRLTLDCDGATTVASLAGKLDSGSAKMIAALRPGSLLSVSGVASILHETTPASDYSPPSRLNVLLSNAQDVTVLEMGSWWTFSRLAIALVAACTVLLGSVVWIFTLRHLVRRRSLQVEKVMRLQRDSELQFQAAQHERQCLATDMHDGVQQLITGAVYRMEAAGAHLKEAPLIVQMDFAAARGSILRAQAKLRESYSGLMLFDEGFSDFGALIAHVARTSDQWPAGIVAVTEHGQAFALSRHVMGSLLLVMQEAVTNAIKHGHARRVEISLGYAADTLEMSVEDDGQGFDPAAAPGCSTGHFGLDSMRHRMQWLGGTLTIESHSGRGACLRACLPRAQSQGALEK